MSLFASPFMRQAFTAARAAADRGEVPVGAVVVQHGRVVACASNRVEELHDPSAHAELLALRHAAQRLGDTRLPDCDLYVTLEPCPLCASAISLFRIRRLYYGAYDPKSGGIDHGPQLYRRPGLHHRPEVYGGFSEKEAAEMIKSFFMRLR